MHMLDAAVTLRLHDAAVVDDAGPSRVPLADAAILVISVWHDATHPQPFRARVSCEDAKSGERRSVATSNPHDVIALVSDWLAQQAPSR